MDGDRRSPGRSRILLLPSLWASRNRARRREQGDLRPRRCCSAAIGLGVMGALFYGAFWVTWQAAQYAELGDYLIRIGLSWLFLTFLSFLAFSGVVTALSTFFLSDDLRLMLAAPVAVAAAVPRALRAHASAQAGWMVVVFLVPVLAGIGVAQVRAVVVRRHGDADRRAVRGHPGGARLGGDAAAGQRVSGPARARHPDADGPACSRSSLVLLLRVHAARAAAARRVDARRHRLLRDAAVADHAAAAVVLGGRGAVCRRCRAAATGCTSRALWTTALAAVVIGRAGRSSAGTSPASARRRKRGRRASRSGACSIALAATAAAVAGAPAPADQGPEGVPARRQPVVAAAAAARAGAGLSLQLPRARSRAHPVHERRS